jgi:hypothetical protein
VVRHPWPPCTQRFVDAGVRQQPALCVSGVLLKVITLGLGGVAGQVLVSALVRAVVPLEVVPVVPLEVVLAVFQVRLAPGCFPVQPGVVDAVVPVPMPVRVPLPVPEPVPFLVRRVAVPVAVVALAACHSTVSVPTDWVGCSGLSVICTQTV